MALQLNFPVEVKEVPTVRDADGLALSSRNRHLSSKEREVALRIPNALCAAREEAARGEKPLKCLNAARLLLKNKEDFELDYLGLVEETTLEEVDDAFKGDAIILVAALVGKTRLIDNVKIHFK